MSEEDVKNMLEIVPVTEFKVEALQVKYPIIDWEIHYEGSRSYWKILRVGGIIEAYQSFEDMLKGFDREDLDALWRLVKEKFSTAVPTVDKEKALWLHSNCGVHQVSSTTRRHVMFMLSEKDYPLSNEVMTLMLRDDYHDGDQPETFNPSPPVPPPTQQIPHNYPIWQVIQNGIGPVSVITDTNDMIKVLPPKTAKEVVAREKERKARTTLLIALPEDHLAKFYKMADAKEMWEAIKSKFGGNDKSKKMQKYLLKQQFEGFSVSASEGLHNEYDSAPQLDYDDLEQINDDDDMEEMGLKCRRKDVGYNGNKARDNGRRPAYQDDLKALVTIDGEDINWSGHVEEDTQNYVMMAYSSNNSSSDNESVFMNKESDLEDTSVNDRYAAGMHAVPPPMTRNYMPSGPDVEIDYSKFTYGPKQTSGDESDSKPSEYASCESESSVETNTYVHAPEENTPKGNADTAVKASGGNKAHLADYQEFKGGSVAFGGSNGRITSKGKIKAGSAGTQANDAQSANSEEIDLHEEHFVLPIWSAYSNIVKSSGDKIEKTTDAKPCEKPVSQETTHENHDANTNNTNLLNVVSTPISITGPSRALNDGEPSYLDDPSIPHLEDIYDSPKTTMNISLTPITRIHTIHPKTQIVRDPMSPVQTRSKVNKNSKAHALISQALEDESWVDVMQNELMHCQIKKVWILVDLPFRKKAIGTQWVYRNKKDEKGVVVRNKARLVTQGHMQEEVIDYDEVFTPVARIKAIRIFLAFASYIGFIVFQINVKSAFLHGSIDEEVYATQPHGFVDPKFPNKVYKVVKAIYGLNQAPRAWYATLSTFWSKVKQKEDGIFISQDMYAAKILKKFDFLSMKTASTPIETQNPLVKDEEAADVDVHFYRYLKGQPKLGLWYPKVLSFDLAAYSDSDYVGANLKRKSITEGDSLDCNGFKLFMLCDLDHEP
nr:hypothetical protein [Tanacetum cinerariifolium]